MRIRVKVKYHNVKKKQEGVYLHLPPASVQEHLAAGGTPRAVDVRNSTGHPQPPWMRALNSLLRLNRPSSKMSTCLLKVL